MPNTPKKPTKPKQPISRSVQRTQSHSKKFSKSPQFIEHISIKVYGEDAEMKRQMSNLTNFSNIYVVTLRLLYKTLHRFYGTSLPKRLDSKNPAPDVDYLLLPVNNQVWSKFAETCQTIEEETGEPMSVERLMARAVSIIDPKDLIAVADPIPELGDGIFPILFEHFKSNPTK